MFYRVVVHLSRSASSAHIGLATFSKAYGMNDTPPLPSAPTPYAELNSVLSYLLDSAMSALKDNFVGAYLQGSLAIGDYSEYSDCDFIIVTHRDLSSDELQTLQQLHTKIHELPYTYWRTGLEGSYAPAAILRRWSTEPRDPPGEPRPDDWGDPGMLGSPPRAYPFRYLDHGSKTLVRSEHDNTQVVRWTLREKGIVLAGPNPQDLIDPVSAADLRAEVRQTMDIYLATGLWMPMIAWQAFWVGLFCRILHTLETGEVTSKKAAMIWAQETLEPVWRGLIARAQTLRKGDDEQSARPADPAEVAATHGFAAYCRDYARSSKTGLKLNPFRERLPMVGV